MVNLITCDSAKQASSVKDLLDSNSITYEVSDDGLTYTVKQEDRANATILLGSNDIPSDGYSISDAIDGSFSTTEADKNKKYQLYLEEKMADDLETISNVSKAYVTLSLPSDDGTILSKDEEAYASINLQLSDDMSEEQAAGIAVMWQRLWATSRLKISRSLMETAIRFSPAEMNPRLPGKASSNLTVQQKAEANVTSAVKSVILGTNVYDNVEVGMNLDMNFDQQKVEDYHYYVDDGQTQGYLDSRTESTSESTSGAGGTPGTDTNDDDTTYVLEDGTITSSTTSDITEDYLPSETITTTEKAVGTIDLDNSSLTVVATNRVIYNEDKLKADGTLDNMTFDEFVAQNSDRVKTDVDQDFYDMVSKATGISTDNISIVAYEIPMFQYSEGSGRDWTDYLQIILAVLIFAMLAFVVFRSMRPQQEEALAEEVTVESLLEAQEDQLDDIGFNEKSEARVLIEKFVDENPEAVASLLRNWLNDDWG